VANRVSWRSIILLYVGIDSVSALEVGKASRSSFKKWVDGYMLSKASKLGCTSADLYAARCGVLHNLSAESDLSRKGKGRPIMYAWGKGKAEDLACAGVLLQRPEQAIHIRELIDAFRVGVSDYLEELTKNEKRRQKVLAGASIWLTSMSTDALNGFLRASSQRQERTLV
jgi:hypothetical protein